MATCHYIMSYFKLTIALSCSYNRLYCSFTTLHFRV